MSCVAPIVAVRGSERNRGDTIGRAPVTVTTAAVEVRGLTHRYDSGRETLLALDGVNLDVGEGEFVSLVGPSGCGKTTLLRAVAGLLQPSTGSVGVLGTTPDDARARRVLGLVTQDPGLLPWRSVVANVRLPLEVTGASADVDALLRRVGIERFAGYYPRQLSGGMRQRVALARALAHGPRLLLMDEPFGALDELSREAMRVELLRLWERERISVLFVTHSIREAVLLSDRVVVMSGTPGRVVDEVPVDLGRPRTPALEETAAFAALVSRVRAGLGGQPW
ncbi:MAG: ATP-binding cassette domain-containing protein [Dehalococcoidia bacterium]|nr:ATP-binding cassette domain-containing protein [Dehalococcoidia bacterium]